MRRSSAARVTSSTCANCRCFGDPQADVGAAGHHLRLRVAARAPAGRAAMSGGERWRRHRPAGPRRWRAGCSRQRPLRRRRRGGLPSWPAASRMAGSRCSGTGCPTGPRLGLSRGPRPAPADRFWYMPEQAHHEARRAEAALRAVAVHHGLLHRVQGRRRGRPGLPTVHSARPSTGMGQPDAAVDGAVWQLVTVTIALRLATGAGAAVAFAATFLWCRCSPGPSRSRSSRVRSGATLPSRR